MFNLMLDLYQTKPRCNDHKKKKPFKNVEGKRENPFLTTIFFFNVQISKTNLRDGVVFSLWSVNTFNLKKVKSFIEFIDNPSIKFDSVFF